MKDDWCLATSMKGAASSVIALYGRRFTIEESFRDEKDHRFGFGLADATIGTPERRDRLLFVTMLAMNFLTMIGAREVHLHKRADSAIRAARLAPMPISHDRDSMGRIARNASNRRTDADRDYGGAARFSDFGVDFVVSLGLPAIFFPTSDRSEIVANALEVGFFA